MFILRDQILVHAPVDRCFQLSTSVAVVERELKMHPKAGRTSGHVQPGDTVLWTGWQLGLPQYHQSEIRNFVPNQFFQDAMLARVARWPRRACSAHPRPSSPPI